MTCAVNPVRPDTLRCPATPAVGTTLNVTHGTASFTAVVIPFVRNSGPEPIGLITYQVTAANEDAVVLGYAVGTQWTMILATPR
jgi:hypothetical protein